MAAGRFACVALPLILCLGSIIALLIGTLSGVTHNSLYLFSLDIRNIEVDGINPKKILEDAGVDLDSLDLPEGVDLDNIDLDSIDLDNIDLDNIDVGELIGNIGKRSVEERQIGQIADGIIADEYEVTLWGYCRKFHDRETKCTDAEFDWASKKLDTSFLDDLSEDLNLDLELPSEIKDALNAFKQVAKYTQIAFIAALLALGVNFIIGIFATCTRVISCLSWVIAGVATVLTIIAAGLATATATVVVGAVEGSNKFYGIKGDINTRFLAVIWAAAALALASILFWVFTMCCCKPDRRSSRRDSDDGEKLLPQRGYAQINDDHEMQSGFYNNQSHNNSTYNQQSSPYLQQEQQYPQYGYASNLAPSPSPQYSPSYDAPQYPHTARTDLAYEPYSHRA